MRIDVVFAEGRVRFPPDHLTRSRVGSDGTLMASTIRDADATDAPPEIRTITGDTLFVSATQSADLVRFCRLNGVPLRRRPDVWAGLLEPFLDADQHTDQWLETLGELSALGLDPAEVDAVRARIGPLMRAYNAIHLDWCHLGLADLLDAVTSPMLPSHLRTPLGDVDGFYTWAMRIADRGAHRSSANIDRTTAS